MRLALGQCQGILGCTPDALVGRAVGNLVVPDDVWILMDLLSSEPGNVARVRLVRHDGQDMQPWCEISWSEDRGRGAPGYIIFARDISGERGAWRGWQ